MIDGKDGILSFYPDAKDTVNILKPSMDNIQVLSFAFNQKFIKKNENAGILN